MAELNACRDCDFVYAGVPLGIEVAGMHTQANIWGGAAAVVRTLGTT